MSESRAGLSHGLVGTADAGAFLARLTRLDPDAPVRLRSAGGRTALWGRLPWDVLVTREVAGAGPVDVTVSAARLLDNLAGGREALPARVDARWRWPLPPTAAAAVVESLPVGELTRLAAAAADAWRAVEAGGRSVGRRALRDALLDHVALVVTPPTGRRVQVSQRLVQAVHKMGFLGSASVESQFARVCVTGQWVAISAPYGVAWLQSVNILTVIPIGAPPNG